MASDTPEGHPEATPLPNKHLQATLHSDPVGPFSSSPAFSTPLPLLPTKAAAYKPGTAAAARLAGLAGKPVNNAGQAAPSIISVKIDPPALRQLAVRVFKRHNLNIAGTATLPALASFVGTHCGTGWKDDGLAEGVLDEVARLWKSSRPRDPLVRDDGPSAGVLTGMLKIVASSMVGGRVKRGISRQTSFVGDGEKAGVLSRQSSFGMSSLGIGESMNGEEEQQEEDEKELLKDPREWLKVVDAWEHPRVVFNVTKRHFER
jgi:DNA polymerase epsilon subunit 2